MSSTHLRANRKPRGRKLRYAVLSFLLGGTIFALLYRLIESRAQAQRDAEYVALLHQYKILSNQLDQALLVLEDVQQRDDRLYRVILQGEPFARQTRHAAFEDISRYKDFVDLPDAELVLSTSRKLDLLNRQLYIQINSLDDIAQMTRTQKDYQNAVPAIQPVSNSDLKRTASGYGYRIDPIYKVRRFHSGMDFSAPTGTPIFATAYGTVEFVGWKRGYGNTVIIDHGFEYKTLYAHMHKTEVFRGQKLKRGESIGQVGNTGKSTSPHLHYEVRLRGNPQNPAHYYFLDLDAEQYDEMIDLSNNHGQMMD